ncbi:hypothetical protein XENTR_v10013548 [Xenopus tropicalis]|nr:hypothetical protein XENTR_v10013548 [Xenopus tropicalis]
MASARNFFKRLLRPFILFCNIKSRRKKSSDANNTNVKNSCNEEKNGFLLKKPNTKINKLESEEATQVCTNYQEQNEPLSTCIREEERNEDSVPCKAEQERSSDFSACANVEQLNEFSTLCLTEEYAEKAVIVEPKEETEFDNKEESEKNLLTHSLVEETSNDATLGKNEEEEKKPEPEVPNLCSNEEQRNEAPTSCLKEKKTRKMARKGKRNKKQIPKVENHSTLCQKEENSKKMARKERKNKKRLIKAEIVKNTPTNYEGLYRPLYDCINKGERNEATYKTEQWKTEPDYTPWINEKSMPFTDCLHERRAKKEERKGRKYSRQTIKAEENKKREKLMDGLKSHTRYYADEENELSDDSAHVEVTGQPFPMGNDDWIPELNLTQQHKNDLRGRECLDDRIIDAAQSLLKIQFGAEGLQSCLLSQLGFNPVKGPSVQIHYDSLEKHWLTSCFTMDHVEIADSAKIKHYCTSLRKQINDCYSALVSDPEGTMEILDVDEQDNTHDCGVYAIANAYEFLSGGNPICKYDRKKMRGHLIRCFERRKFSAFPKKADACVVDLEPTLNFTWHDRK